MIHPGRNSSSRRLVALAIAAALALALIAGLALRTAGPDPVTPAAVTTTPRPAVDGNAVRAARLYGDLSLAQRAGQRVIGGFGGRSIPAGLRRAIRTGRLGGVILFSNNLGSRRQIRRLTRNLQRIPRPGGLRRVPLPVTVDQEGGLVKRLAGAPRVSAERMGVRGADFARRQGVMTGRNLVNAGFNVDLAPVLDVARPGGVIDQTDRAFGRSPGRVARVGVAFADGLREGGVAA
ncbi:MAG: hypothetical protein M9938_11105, partial [Solirubrobacterales bacterium]|nr:hypothetical protein [Solirubrobacterales bacterium]